MEPKLERTTQTVKLSTRKAQTMREAATQMERPGVILDTTFDTVRCMPCGCKPTAVCC